MNVKKAVQSTVRAFFYQLKKKVYTQEREQNCSSFFRFYCLLFITWFVSNGITNENNRFDIVTVIRRGTGKIYVFVLTFRISFILRVKRIYFVNRRRYFVNSAHVPATVLFSFNVLKYFAQQRNKIEAVAFMKTNVS